jgi:tripartite-type tricarboxylate transporter receptor subunit TctC
MGISRRSVIRSGVAIASAAAISKVFAQAGYPNRFIRLVVPYPAGGGTDYFARLVARPMSESLGQPVVIENKPGAGTIVGAEFVVRSPADGYTLLLGDNATYATNKNLYAKLVYDPQTDLAPVSLTGRFAIVLLANTDKLAASSLQELVALARKTPSGIDYASSGIGSPFHLAAEMLRQAADIKLNHVPYRGATSAIQGLLGGEASIMFVDFATARSQLSNPKIKALAVASASPFAGLPGVPTVASVYPGFEAWAWQGFSVPKSTPRGVVQLLHDTYVKSVASPEIRQKLTDAGIEPLQSTPDEMARYISEEIVKWGAVIKAANIQLH